MVVESTVDDRRERKNQKEEDVVVIATQANMSESYFTKIANEVLEASEKLTNRLEEGINLLLGEFEGGASAGGSGSGPSQPQQPGASDSEFEGWDEDMDMEDMDDGSPLKGIAESVMGDIMAGQVSAAAPMHGWLSCRHCRDLVCHISTVHCKKQLTC